MLMDTSAWIEFFRGSEKGRRVKGILQEEKCQSPLLSLAELSQWCAREGKDPKDILTRVDSLSEILIPDRDLCLLAGELNFRRKQKLRKWGMMDSFILAAALLYDLVILTADSDFRDLENAVLL